MQWVMGNDLFKKATRKGFNLRLALTGPSGSGKTYSALTIAKQLGKKIALIDTENGSAGLYCDKFDFDMAEMHEPYLIKKYLKAMEAAFGAEYDVLIIDSLSHAWLELLRAKEALDSRGGNSFANWGKITPEHEKLKDAILHPKCHLICTMRSKQAYALEENDRGKTVPKKVGLAPVQREGMDYEFDICLDIAVNHSALASKDRSGLFDTDVPFLINDKVGVALRNWVGSDDGSDAKLKVSQGSRAKNTSTEGKKAEGNVEERSTPNPDSKLAGATQLQVDTLKQIQADNHFPNDYFAKSIFNITGTQLTETPAGELPFGALTLKNASDVIGEFQKEAAQEHKPLKEEEKVPFEN